MAYQVGDRITVYWPMVMAYQVGDRITVYWPLDRRMFKGTVTLVSGPGDVKVPQLYGP